ncbi:uncharacterized protein K489DRAFT_376864 [Dissoconium aciculare CBS 342.82]|uniref:Uncharacterized protein n=1 Tax=Dissoconium aciculare CBS 342.82 TaxID=1314786 RepID=A0A6J3MEM3_9PEZI|nr:uncharacterized protein K489DRAFT_376864 [Dissoconium aciculare CBS 342.82]KAF1826455.1 hypothetical protein K489DRAFT_376864 [Dissoconium aciculare CBS 342.82]
MTQTDPEELDIVRCQNIEHVLEMLFMSQTPRLLCCPMGRRDTARRTNKPTLSEHCLV